ncbi:polysaccharide deacetylase family protein [Parendozoicomonas haliclonae]|uniref:Poly-beta-1,6-N-acetyl-D-glucosamine N-deacetylase n=1 Tax=Parendozoicomonas haliclonae TaxID=1960125 RepID=A0A1X7AH58_9GAMM|nr:polysaccharide deacetylase family protein [Parendozoicomonas haliclonae]SMA40692.1 Poly-beta-1,6-N-acetyl-D-glucosamine N-deacetylase precursor [Parendozoicomonas haliclonae]
MLRRIKTLFSLTLALSLFSSMAQAVVVLQYHHIDDTTPKSTSTSPALFKEHLNWIKENNYRVAPLTEITDLLRTGQPLPDKTIVITFDDAFTSIYEQAFPALKEHNYPFTIFINTGSVDERHRRALSWKQLREMGEAGATLANHTIDHGHLVERLPDEKKQEWLDRIATELRTAEKRIKEETGQNHKLLAWPFGETTPELEQLVLNKGYIALGQQSGAVGLDSNKAKLPRYPMGAGYGSMKNFPLKAKSLALPVTSITPESSLAPTDGNLAPLQITLKPGQWNAGQIACYALGSTLDINWLDKQKTIFEIAMPSPLPLGRSRINCTAPGPEGRWFWFSKDWVRLTQDGQALD